MGSLTSRGRALVVVAFLVSAALCATSAVALVRASRDEGTPAAQSSPTPSPSATESPTPSPTASPTPVVTVTPTPAVTPTANPTPTASPAPRTTSSPKPKPTRTTQPAGLFLDAILDPANGTVPGQVVDLFAHATDGDGTIHLVSVDWGDGTKVTTFPAGTSKDCAATGKGDCKDFVLHHSYAAYDTYTVTITIASSGPGSTIPESSSLSIDEFVNGPSPAPSPTA